MAWINVPKPTESSALGFSGGDPIGLLIALTYSNVTTSIISGWTDVDRPTSSLWTIVPKATSSVWTAVAKPTS